MDKIVFDLTIVLMFVLLLAGIFAWTGTVLISKYLSKKYDPILFKKPYFTEDEQLNYREFPLTLHKTIIYLSYFTYPFLAKKRFKNVPAPQLEIIPKISAYIIMTVGIATIPLTILLLIMVAYVYSRL